MGTLRSSDSEFRVSGVNSGKPDNASDYGGDICDCLSGCRDLGSASSSSSLKSSVSDITLHLMGFCCL